MKDARRRVPEDGAYFYALGEALVCFARLEWAVVYCCEQLKPGYVRKLTGKRKTAGQIADDFEKNVTNHASAITDATLLGQWAKEFRRLVDRRNGLLHGKPGTSAKNEQRLFEGGAEWTMEAVNGLADEFTDLAITVNDWNHARSKS